MFLLNGKKTRTKLNPVGEDRDIDQESSSLIDSHNSSNSTSGQLLLENIHKQETTLQSKIIQRKQQYKNLLSQIYRKKTVTDEKRVEIFQRELASILEQAVIKKHSRTINIQRNYAEQLRIIQTSLLPPEAFNELSHELSTQLTASINQMKSHIDLETTEHIKSLKMEMFIVSS